jgi:hypothetical protein
MFSSVQFINMQAEEQRDSYIDSLQDIASV